MEWVIENKLARSCRPGYDDEDVDPEVVLGFIEEWKREGIQSVICLLDDKQLNYYSRLPYGLLETYRREDFQVISIKVADYKSPAMSPSELNKVSDAYKALPKPCLVHCSAGMDRTGAAVEFLLSQLT